MKSCLAVVVMNHFLRAQSGPYANISIRIVDKDTKSPIPNIKVELAQISGHGTDYDILQRTLVGATDECGDFATSQPLSLAKYSTHGIPVDSTFVFLFTDCLYGQLLVFYHVPQEHQEVTIAKPMLYSAQVITDDSKAFIQLNPKISCAYLFTFPDYKPGVQLPSPRADAANGVLILKANLSELLPVYSTGYVGENYTYTDYDVTSPDTYTYFVSASSRNVAGCSAVTDTIKVVLNDQLPDTISYLPRYTTPCAPIVGEVEIQSTIYPVPYQDKLAVEVTEDFDGPVDISVTNTLGQEIYHLVLPSFAPKYELDLSHLRPGIQMPTIFSGKKVKTFKIVKSE